MPISGVQNTLLLQMRAQKAYVAHAKDVKVEQKQELRDNMDKITISEEARQRVLEAANEANKKIVANQEKSREKPMEK